MVTGRRPPRPGETKRQGQRFRLRRGGQRPREMRRFPRDTEWRQGRGSRSVAYCSGLRKTGTGGAAARGKRAPVGVCRKPPRTRRHGPRHPRREPDAG